VGECLPIWVSEVAGPTQRVLLELLNDGLPHTSRELVAKSKLSNKAVVNCLHRLWKSGNILRTEKPSYDPISSFKGRAGIAKNTRAYHRYVYQPDRTVVHAQGVQFVKFQEQFLDSRGSGINKAHRIRQFVLGHSDQAFYSTEIVQALEDEGVQQQDVMSTIRRAERKGLVYVRGYRTHNRQTPFREGYLVTGINSQTPREQALEDAIQRTNQALNNKSSTSPIIERVHLIRDAIIEGSKLRDLVSFEFLHNKIHGTEYEAEHALKRALQLYPDLKEVKLFNAYRYFYHALLADIDLNAAIIMKENYVRMVKGRANRIGHNWEAIPGWFIDNLTPGAKFWTQKHRRTMDPRRITIHLMKPVGGRRQNAEVDRVWQVTPGPLLQPTTYVLECKWGLVRKGHIDDFFNVVRWSKEFGVDTPDGRQIKQGITGVFAGSSFDPKEQVRLKDESVISLASYAARMNIQLLKAIDFNEKLRSRNVPNAVTVQKICRYAKDEKEVRAVLSSIWEHPEKSNDIMANILENNQDVFKFETMLERK
jgi:hypothetical protein